MSTILQELESQIAGLKTAVTRSNVGVVREVGDGVANDTAAIQAAINPLMSNMLVMFMRRTSNANSGASSCRML